MATDEQTERLEGWTKVSTLAFAPALIVALAYDHAWWGPAVRAVGAGIAGACFFSAAVWIIATGAHPR